MLPPIFAVKKKLEKVFSTPIKFDPSYTLHTDENANAWASSELVLEVSAPSEFCQPPHEAIWQKEGSAPMKVELRRERNKESVGDKREK